MGAVFSGLSRCGSSTSGSSAEPARAVQRGIPAAPNPPRLVNDFAGVLGGRADELEQMLVAFDDSTSNQITVVTVPSLDGYDVAEYALELGRRWGVGKSINNGVVVLVKPKNSDGGGDVTIQVGYGLEGAIPDAYCRRIIDNEMIPAFKEEDYYKGIASACDQLMKLASGEISEPRTPEDPSGWAILLGFFLPLILLSSSSPSSIRRAAATAWIRVRAARAGLSSGSVPATAALPGAPVGAVPAGEAAMAAASAALAAVPSAEAALPATGDA